MNNNADVDVVNDVGETILFFIARFGGKYRLAYSLGWPQYLIINDQIISSTNFPIGDDETLAEFLIKKGAKLDVSNIKGETPLHIAAKLGKFLQLFSIKYWILTDWKIYFYILVGHKKIGESFIRNHAKKDATNNESQTPLHYAVKYGNWSEQIVSFKNDLFNISMHIIQVNLNSLKCSSIMVLMLM